MEQRQLVDNIFKQSSTSSTVLYFVDSIVSNKCSTMDFHLPVKDLIQIRLITLILKLFLAIMNNGCGAIIDEWEKLKAIASNTPL